MGIPDSRSVANVAAGTLRTLLNSWKLGSWLDIYDNEMLKDGYVGDQQIDPPGHLIPSKVELEP